MIDQDERPVTEPAVPAPTSSRRRLRTASGALSKVTAVVRSLPSIGARRYRLAKADALARPERATRLLAVVVAVATVLAGLCWFGAHRHAETVQARVDATAAANRSVVKLMSYNFHSIDRQLDETKGLTTGQFTDDYTNLVQNVLRPGAMDKQAEVQAAVLKSSVVSSSSSEVTLFVFIVQQSETLANPGGDQTESTVRVTMDNQNGAWLVSDLKPE